LGATKGVFQNEFYLEDFSHNNILGASCVFDLAITQPEVFPLVLWSLHYKKQVNNINTPNYNSYGKNKILPGLKRTRAFKHASSV